MSLRLISVILPAQACQSVRTELGEIEILSAWVQPLSQDAALAGLFVRTENTEAILDRLNAKFGARPDFRALLLPVEATLPRVEEPQAKPVEQPAVSAISPRISREELLNKLAGGVEVSRLFITLAVISAVVAAIGLIQDNVAALIGAMVMAPLLTPNVALTLATTLADMELGRRALATNLVGVLVVLALSVLIGLVFTFDPHIHSLEIRTRAGFSDVAIALAAGTAGALAYTTGLSSGLIGVMVAVALMPPLVAAGLLLGAGQFSSAFGAMLLVATNVVCINLSGVVTFLVQGVRPHSWWEAARARRAIRIALILWTALLLTLVALLLLQNADARRAI